MRILPLIFIVALFCLNSCTDSEKEKQLQIREEILSTKEKTFAAKEVEFQALLQMRDSLKSSENHVEIQNVLPSSLLGKWNGKMICTDSNCADHIIGDQRNDLWEFTPDALKIINKTGGERIFQAEVTSSEIKFTSADSITTSTSVEMVFNLNDLSEGRWKGSRSLTGKNDCVAQFSIDLQKIKN